MATEKANDKPRTYRFNDYFKEGKRMQYWPTFDTHVTDYHVTYETLIKTILKNNFSIQDYVDSKPNIRYKKRFPKQYKLTRDRPHFCAFMLKKVK